MRTWLIIGTAVEIVLVIGVLAVYLVLIVRSLKRINRYLGRVAFGVRAIESQTAPIGTAVTRVNGQLATIAGAFERLAGLAESTADGTGGQPRG